MNPTNPLIGRPATSWTADERAALTADWTERLTRVGHLRHGVTIVDITTRPPARPGYWSYTLEITLHGGITPGHLRRYWAALAADLDATTDRPVNVGVMNGSRPSRALVTVVTTPPK